MSLPDDLPKQRHALYEDALAILTATLFMAIGVGIYANARLAAGGTVGLGLLLQYATGWGFWSTFSLVSVPFYALALWRMGGWFTLRTALAVTLVSAFSAFLPRWMPLGAVDPIFAALGGSTLIGIGLLILFRHRTALGGTNILAIYLNQRLGWSIPMFQFAFDAVVLLTSLAFIPPWNVLLSLLGAAVVNIVIAVNHRPGRYMGMT